MFLQFFFIVLFSVFSFSLHAQEKKAEPAPPPAVEQKTLCKEREGCRLLWTHAAGKDEKGRDLFISEVVLPSPPEWSCRRPQNNDYGEFLKNVRQEIWLSSKGGILPEHNKIMDFCNDGYGAADIGDNVFTIHDGLLTHRAFGGSAQRWMNGRTLRLPSLEVASVMGCSFHSLYGGDDFKMFDYDTGAFRMGWNEQVRGEGQVPAKDDFIDCDATNLEKANARYEALMIKQVHSFLGLRLNEVKELGSCATTLSTKEGAHEGYVVYGQDDGSADAEVKLLRINDDTLWVSLSDKGRTFKSSKNWEHDDRIEIWWLEQKAKTPYDGSRGTLRQFIIRLADLSIFAGYGYNDGKKKLPFVERRDGQGLSFSIRWPPDQFPSSRGLTLAYARGDGAATSVMWATSTLKYGDADTLSPVIELQRQGDDPMQSCRINKDGVLELLRPTFERPKNP